MKNAHAHGELRTPPSWRHGCGVASVLFFVATGIGCATNRSARAADLGHCTEPDSAVSSAACDQATGPNGARADACLKHARSIFPKQQLGLIALRPHRFEDAERYFAKACELNANYCVPYAEVFMLGDGVPVDVPRAQRILRSACRERSSTEACYELLKVQRMSAASSP